MATTAATHAARTAVYRLYDTSGQLLYVGVARNPPERMKFHRQFKRWWSDVARTDLVWFPDRASALAAESVAIRKEQPLYNIFVAGEDGSVRARRELPALAIGKMNHWYGHIGGKLI